MVVTRENLYIINVYNDHRGNEKMANLKIYVTDAQERQIRKSAEAERKSISEYCREVLTNEADAPKVNRAAIEEELAEIRRELAAHEKQTRALIKMVYYHTLKSSKLCHLSLEALYQKENPRYFEELDAKITKEVNEIFDKLE